MKDLLGLAPHQPGCVHCYDVAQITGLGIRFCLNCGRSSVLWRGLDGAVSWVPIVEGERQERGVPEGAENDRADQAVPGVRGGEGLEPVPDPPTEARRPLQPVPRVPQRRATRRPPAKKAAGASAAPAGQVLRRLSSAAAQRGVRAQSHGCGWPQQLVSRVQGRIRAVAKGATA